MNPWARVAAAIGLGRAKAAAVGLVVLLAGGSLTAAGLQVLNSSVGEGVLDTAELARRAGDADVDGLADILENHLGSDRGRRDTLGHGVPDGWVHHWFRGAVDWNASGLLLEPALVPPADAIPEPLRGGQSLPLPSVLDVYEHEAQGRDSTAWWIGARTLDPLDWDNDDDGIADAWLLLHGLEPWKVDAGAAAPGDPAFTLRQKYDQGLDPTKPDTDGDGLADRAELDGIAFSPALRFTPTDPRLFSTRRDGLPDGLVVRIGMPSDDVAVADRTPTPNGLSVREAFEETERACQREAGAACVWADRLASGAFVDPTKPDSNGDGVPDAWIVRAAASRATVLDDATKIVVADSAAWDTVKWAPGAAAPSLVVDEANPQPAAPYKVTLAQMYAFGRPPAWDEAVQGPWWGGIPANFTAPRSSLPLAVALRGWGLAVDTCRGCAELTPLAARQRLDASADPRLADSDGDGLTDLEEYLGDGTQDPRTNPLNPDTDGDGLGDAQERKTALGTDPVRRDTPGSFLTDGESHSYWMGRHAAAVHEMQAQGAAAAVRYRFLAPAPGVPVRLVDLDRLLPLGSLDGETPNLLAADADGDGIRNGAELYPNLYLDVPTSQTRPATDPARADSDGDRLPDAWEIRWSRTQDFGCDAPCRTPVQGFQGWPINPARYDSFDPQATEVAPGGSASDFGRNLKGDELSPDDESDPVPFTNGLAYEFDLDPYRRDSSPQDGIPDLFALYWGVLHVPEDVRTAVDQSVATGSAQFGWVKQAAEALADRRPDEFTTPLTHAVMDPGRALPEVGLGSNLQLMFRGREKGVWVFEDEPCAVQSLPATGPRADGVPPLAGGPPIEARTLDAPCWAWVAYPLRSDVDNGTNPWSHDFDRDQMPDAWEMHYAPDGNLAAAQPTPSSRDAGCDTETLIRALPRPSPDNAAGHCLTFRESYRLGLDPTSITGDTDGGGLPDWLEVAFGNLDPLDEADDRGEEDWDGDGILNRVEGVLGTSRFSPDTDGDGLLDGDWQGIESTPFIAPGEGGGDLCLRPGADAAPLMAHRPPFLGGTDAGGEMTRSQVLAWHRSLGILVNEAPGGRCPAPQQGQAFVLLKREVMLDRWSPGGQPVILGAGGGTDPRLWNTTGTGVPDGWLVHWRDSVTGNENTRRALDPARAESAASNPDGDLPTGQEYRWGRPGDWDEERDGTWWGGLNPTVRDTDGDEDWYRSVFNGLDSLDQDADSDGLPLGVDPFPGIDHGNQGTVARKAGGGYATNHTALWAALKARGGWDLLDRDGDRVPDAIDRARAQVSASFTDLAGQPLGGLSKSSPRAFLASGQLMAREAPLPGRLYDGGAAGAADARSGVPVQGATVTILVSDGEAVAVAGAAITDAQGRFAVQANLSTALALPALAEPASIRGRHHPAGAPLSIPSGAGALRPGVVSVWAMAEPNDPVLQPLRFGGAPAVHAYKDVAASDANPARGPETAPGEAPALRAARLGVAGTGPDLDAAAVQHAAEAIAAAHSAAVQVDLRAQSQLSVAIEPAAPRHGMPFTVAGALADFAGVPLDGGNVTLRVGSGAAQQVRRIPTATDGSYSSTFDTGPFPVGTLPVRAEAELSDGDRFVDPPAPVDLFPVLAQQTAWDEPLTVSGEPRLDGGEVVIDPDQPLRVVARLREQPSGLAVGGRAVHLVVSAADPPREIAHVVAQTGADGTLDALLPRLPADAPLGLLALALEAEDVTDLDEPARAKLFLSPRFATQLSVANASALVGQDVVLQGRLDRVVNGAAHPLEGAHGSIAAICGGKASWANATGPGGAFAVRVRSDVPGDVPCSLRFTPASSALLRTSPFAAAHAAFRSPTALRLAAAQGAVGSAIEVAGQLVWGAANPVAGQAVLLGWGNETPVAASTGEDGGFTAQMPARGQAGPALLVARFNGTAHYLPSVNRTAVPVRAPTLLSVAASNASVAVDGGAAGGVSVRLLVLDKPTASRQVHFDFRHPSGAVRSADRVTNGTGEALVRFQDLDLDRPGAWAVNASFAGSATELPSRAAASFAARLGVRAAIGRASATAFPGEAIAVQGTTLAPNGAAVPVLLELRMADILVATVQATSNADWHAVARLPLLPPGAHALKVLGSPGQPFDVEGSEAPVTLRETVEARLQVQEQADGSRTVDVRLFGQSGERVLQSVRMVLVRQEEGRVVQVYDVESSPAGIATLDLGADEAGEVTVLQLDSRVLALDAVFVDTHHALATVAPGPRGPAPWLAWAAAGAAALLAVAGAVSFYAWRSSGRRGIERMLRQAQQALLDPRLPAAEVVRRAYANVLEALKATGWRPAPDQTVRSITEGAGSAFGLPAKPWRTLSGMFEAVAYSQASFGRADRDAARQAFAGVTDSLVGRRRRGGA